MNLLLPLVVAATTMLFAVVTAYAAPQWAQGPTCTENDVSIHCEGKLAGIGEGSTAYLVIYAQGGCTTPSGANNPPGQLQYTTPLGTQTGGGNLDVNVTVPIRCPGQQTPFVVNGTVTAQAWVCTSGQPRFNKQGQQTNSSCTLAS